MPGGWQDDHPAAGMLDAEFRSWDDPSVDWEAFDRVVIRSTWDYTDRVQEFLAWCALVGPHRLRNPPDLVAFNADKRYLGQLSVATVPTRFLALGDPLPRLEGEVVVKPNISAGARDTGRFGPAAHRAARELISRIQASGRVALIQPYMAAVDERGETALVFFGGELSHVLRKRAVLDRDEVAPVTPGEHGVAVAMLQEDLVAAGEADDAERALARRVLGEISHRFGAPLYARVDLVTGPDGEPALLELEAIEPNLYLATSPGASERLVAAVQASGLIDSHLELTAGGAVRQAVGVGEASEGGETSATREERRVALDLVEVRLGDIEHVHDGGLIARRSAQGTQPIDLALNVRGERARHEGCELRLSGLVAESLVGSGKALVTACADRVALREELRLRERRRCRARSRCCAFTAATATHND